MVKGLLAEELEVHREASSPFEVMQRLKCTWAIGARVPRSNCRWRPAGDQAGGVVIGDEVRPPLSSSL